VLLTDTAGLGSIDLRVVGFEFDRESGWLDITGRITDGDGDWSWQAACLTLDEADRLGDWLTAASDGQVGEVELLFTEQDLALKFVRATSDLVTIEWSVPHATEANRSSNLSITTTRTDLVRAAQEWRSTLRALPAT
jgi:hypothetical protein